MRLKVFLSLFYFSFFVLTAFARQNDQEIFLQANNFYKQGEFKKALEDYQKLLNPSAQVNYNLGNCAYKLEDYGRAMLYWKRAEKEWGFLNRSELLSNIDLLKEKLFGKKEYKNKTIERFVHAKNYFISLLYSAPLFGVQVLFLIIWIIGFVYIKYLFRRDKKFLIILLFALMTLFGGLLVTRCSLDLNYYAVVISPKIEVLSGPGDNFRKLGVLSQANLVRIQKISDDYYKIKVQGLIGWVNQKDLEKI